MRKLKTEDFFTKLSKILFSLLFLISLSLIVLHFLGLIDGFYFTGDTISAFEPSVIGKPINFLSVFIHYYAVWPPAVGFFFSILRLLPVSLLSQNQIYTLLISLLSLIPTYFLAKNFTNNIKEKVIILSLILYGGVQEFLFSVAISEPIFILFWLTTILFITKFMTTLKERYIVLFIISATLMTLSRYSGISILGSFILIMLIFVYNTYKEKKYSLLFVLSSFIYVWIPLAAYLVRNITINARLFGEHDLQFTYVTLPIILSRVLPDLYQDLPILLLISLLIGTNIVWTKRVKYISYLSGISALVYLFFLISSLLHYRFQDGIHSRFVGISYPELSLATIGLGSFFASKYPKLKKMYIAGLLLGIIYFVYSTTLVWQRIYLEDRTSQSVIAGTEYSKDIKTFCLGNTENKYLLIQEFSRDWVGQSLKFYCQPIKTVVPSSLPYTFPANSWIYSVYRLSNPGLTPVNVYIGEKTIYLYKTNSKVELAPTEHLKNLQMLD